MMAIMPLNGLRVLVVDDEAPARQRLVDLLQRDSRVTAITEAGDAAPRSG